MKRYLLLSFLFFATLASAQIPVAKKNTFVNDYAGVLAPADAKALNQKIFIIQKETNVQLAVVLVKKIPAAYTIKSFAAGIGRKWHVGTKKRGLVYVAAIDEHSQRLSVAQNLTPVFTPEKSDAILSSMKTAYRNADYAGGLTILVNKIHTTLVPQAEVKPEPKPVVADVPAAKADDKAVAKDDNSDILPGVIFFSLVVLAIVVIYYRSKLKQQKITAETMIKMQDIQNGGYNQGGYSGGDGAGVYRGGGGGYSSARRPVQGSHRSSTGSFLTGAALGAAGGYGARYLQDKLNEQHQHEHNNDNVTMPDSFARTPISSDNNDGNWGNWGDGDHHSDSGFSDDDNDSSYDSGSSDDSGFSDSSDDTSGSTSNW